MIENSPIHHRTIYNSFEKLKRAASDGKFKIKSLRIKTSDNEMEEHLTNKLGLPLIYPNQSTKKIASVTHLPSLSPTKGQNTSIVKSRVKSFKIIQKNFEQELNNLGVDTDFLTKLFVVKSEESQNKQTEQRYQVFLRNLATRFQGNKHLSINQMGFAHKTLQFFFNWYVQWQGHIIQLDLSYASESFKQSKMSILKRLLEKDQKLLKLSVCNSSLNGQDITELLKIINERKHLFVLDVSNQNSQSLNRFGECLNVLENFVKTNQSVSVLKLNNLQIKSEGFQYICDGVSQRKINPLRILSLANNYITGNRLTEAFYSLSRSGLTHLNLSSNPLGEQFYKNLPILKNITIKELDLSQTNMNSECLFEFFNKIVESKSLSTLILDNNDFSHHWFGKIGEQLQTNTCLQSISFNNCQIKTFLPIFQGLALNKYLKIIYANNNSVNLQNGLLLRIKQCFAFNKDLQQMHFKFCNFNEEIICAILEGVINHKKLRVLDFSQNLLSDGGALAILKVLQQNIQIEYIGIQKIQISQLMRKRIESKLQENKQVRNKLNLNKLKQINKEIKVKDSYTWEDVQKYNEEERRLVQKLQKIEITVGKLQKIFTNKKKDISEFKRKCKEDQREIQQITQEKIRCENERVQNEQKQYKKVLKIQQNLKIQCLKEEQMIKSLQQKIKKQNQHIRQRESQLQDLLRNHKYRMKAKVQRPQQHVSYLKGTINSMSTKL